MENVKRDPRGQGERGEQLAAPWFESHGVTVFVPFLHNPRDFDFIVEWGDGVHRIQVKTSTQFRKGRWDVAVCTTRRQPQLERTRQRLDPTRYEYLFVVVGDGRQWLIPLAEVTAELGSGSGGPKYGEYEIEPGQPLLQNAAPLDSAPPWRDSRAVKGDATVNALAQPSQVRILLPPLGPTGPSPPMDPDESEPSDSPDDEVVERDTESDDRAVRLRRLAVQVDSQPSLLTAAQRLRRRLPGDERFGDPMSTAGAQPVEVVARRVSAMQPERKSVLQELGLGALQVWQSLSEAAGRGHGDQQMAVLFTDLVGFSSWALRAGDGLALELLREVGTSVEAAILRWRGRIVKRLGDGVMATFLTAPDAVEAALEARAAVAEIDIEGYRPRLRAGVHWGSPRRLGGDYLGVDVNVAARVADAAKADQVLVSDVLLAQLEPADAAELRTGRAKRLRGRRRAPRPARRQHLPGRVGDCSFSCMGRGLRAARRARVRLPPLPAVSRKRRVPVRLLSRISARSRTASGGRRRAGGRHRRRCCRGCRPEPGRLDAGRVAPDRHRPGAAAALRRPAARLAAGRHGRRRRAAGAVTSARASPRSRASVARLQGDLSARRRQLLRVRDELDAAQTKLGGLEAAKAAAERVLGEELVGNYEGGRPDIISVVLESNGFADLLERLAFAQRVSRQDARIVAHVRSARRAVATEARTLGRLTARAQTVAESVLSERNQVARYRLRLVAQQLAAAKAKATAAGQLALGAGRGRPADPAAGHAPRRPARVPRYRLPPVPAPERQRPPAGIPFPFPAGNIAPPATWSLGEGVSIAAPAGTPELAVCSGTIVLHGIGGLGPSAPVLRCDQPLSGHLYVYYGYRRTQAPGGHRSQRRPRSAARAGGRRHDRHLGRSPPADRLCGLQRSPARFRNGEPDAHPPARGVRNLTATRYAQFQRPLSSAGRALPW